MSWSPVIDMGQMIERGLIRLSRGKVISKKDIAQSPGPYPIYSSARLNNGKFGQYGHFMFEEELITWSVDGGGAFFYRPKHRFSVTNVGGILKVLDKSQVHCKFMYHVLSHKHSRLQFDWTSKAHPSVIRRLYTAIPLPPLAEQKRIARILDAADALRARRRESLAQLDSLLQSAFFGMFGDPVTNPMGWNTASLESVAALDRQSVEPSEAGDETPYLGLEHLDGAGGINCAETVGSAELKSSKYRFTECHILFGKLRPYLRKIAKPGFSGVCSTDIIPILPGDRLVRSYLFSFLRTPAIVELATGRSTGANLPRLSPKQLASFEIPLPPLDLQRRFAAIVESVERQKELQRAHLAELDTLFASLQQRAFNGELSA